MDNGGNYYFATHRDPLNNTLLAGKETLTKLNPAGDTLWSTTVPSRYPGRKWQGAAVTQDRQGNYVVLGNSRYTIGGAVVAENIHLARFRPTGQVVNDTMLYRQGQTYGRSLHLAANGELVASGYGNNGPNGGSDLFMLQFRGFRPLASKAEAAAVAGLAVYPNPAAGSEAVRLTLPERPGPYALVVLDALGRPVRQQAVPPGSRAVAVPVVGLPPGLYVLRLTGPGGQSWATKLVRE